MAAWRMQRHMPGPSVSLSTCLSRVAAAMFDAETWHVALKHMQWSLTDCCSGGQSHIQFARTKIVTSTRRWPVHQQVPSKTKAICKADLPVAGHLLCKGGVRGVVLDLEHEGVTAALHQVPPRPERLEEL